MQRNKRPLFVWLVAGMAAALACTLFVSVLNVTAAPAAQNCTNDAEIVEESSDPPELVLSPGQPFSKTWRIRNTGDCRWSTQYSLNLADGSHMGGGSYAPISRRVSPNGTYATTLDFLAPTVPGTYHAEWELMDANFEPFGPPLNVDVEVSNLAAEPELPDVLLLAGLGMGGEGCYDTQPEGDEAELQVVPYGRGADICPYNLPTGTLVEFTLAGPDGERFTTARLVDQPLERFDADGNSLGEHTLVSIGADWIAPAPAGEWTLTAEAEGVSLEQTIEIPEAEAQPVEGPTLTHAPAAPVNPFRSALLCSYDYYPGDRVVIHGAGFPADSDLHFGIYGQREAGGYSMFLSRVYTDTVTTSDTGEFSTTYDIPAGALVGDFWMVAGDPTNAFEDVDGDGFIDASGLPGSSCFGVRLQARSPIGGLQLAYVDGPADSGDIHVFDLDSGEIRDLAVEACDETAPAYWPDGYSVVYQSDCRGSYDIYRVDAWSGEPRRLTTASSYDEGEPAVSPDGTTLLFRRTPTGEFESEDGELMLRNVDKRAVTPLGIAGRAPVWSPDGAQIAYMARPDGKWQVFVYDMESGESRLVSEECPTQCGYPAWSPDGEALAYSVSRSGRRFVPDAIWISPLEGGEPQVWQDGGADAPAWSIGRLLAFTTEQGIEAVLDPSEADEADQEPQVLVEEEGVREPAWSR